MIVNSNPGKYLAALATRNAIAAYREIQEKTMTKTTEELKREMYDLSVLMRNNPYTDGLGNACYRLQAAAYRKFEDALDAYLEALRQESSAKDVRIDHLERMGDVMRDGYMCQQQLTSQARSEADRERNRAQAFEFANKSAGEFLIESQGLVKQYRETNKRQRQSIGKLKNERDNFERTVKVRTSQRDGFERQLLEARQELSELRKLVGTTSVQIHEEIASSERQDKRDPVHGMVFVCRAEFDDRFRTTCSACNQQTDVMK